MSPRRNRPARPAPSGGKGRGRGAAVGREQGSAAEPLDVERARRGVAAVQQWSDGEWLVRSIPAGSATKTYRCPGCQQEIAPGVAHVVAWPADGRGDLTDRRHWHSGCWRARDRRSPGIMRSRSAPRYG